SDGKRLVTGDVLGTVTVWQADPVAGWKWERLRTTTPLDQPLAGNDLALAVSPDGRRVAACPASTNTVAVWDLDDGRPAAPLPVPRQEKMRGLAWSRDGRRLAVAFNYAGSGSRKIMRWDVEKGEWERDPWPVSLGHIFMFTFSPDESHIAVGCQEGFGVFDT